MRTKRFSSRILLIVLLSFALSSFYYVFNLYKNKIESAESGALQRLEGISNTLASQINGTMMKMILEKFETEDAVKDKYADPYYREIVEILQRTASLNNLPTDIYTLSLDTTNQTFFFGLTSGEKQYYRHIYKDPPALLIEKYTEGAVIPMYADEHGTWLSAFAPLKDGKGETVAVVQADLPFDHFISEARSSLYKNIIYNSILILVISTLLYYWLKTLLHREEKIMNQLAVNNEIINKKNEDITASISYAQRIQRSLMDSENKLKSLFPSSFVLYQPKDIVSGDFYWIQSMNKDRSKIAVAAADCTGHGVPGALVSVLGITFLREIVAQSETIEPGEILEELNRRIINTFKNTGKGITSKDGMDISLAVIDFNERKMCYAGAYRPLLILRNGELTEVPGDKQPIGGDHFVEDRKFTNHELTFEDGDWLYMFSDGYVDQFGGEKSRKFMKKRFKSLVLDITHKDCDSQKNDLEKELQDWMMDFDQIDDITVLGLELKC